MTQPLPIWAQANGNGRLEASFILILTLASSARLLAAFALFFFVFI
jgi:hypothetical protein